MSDLTYQRMETFTKYFSVSAVVLMVLGGVASFFI